MKMRNLTPGLAALSLVFACGTSQQPPTGRTTGAVDPDCPILDIGDVVRVSVWKNPDLTFDVPVREDGSISLPLVESLPAAGHSLCDLEAAAERAFSEYVSSPDVSIELLPARPILDPIPAPSVPGPGIPAPPDRVRLGEHAA